MITIFFLLLIGSILGLCAASIVQYWSIRSDLKLAANETLTIVKMENGADSSTRQAFNTLLQKLGMDPSKVSFDATPKQVQRGELVEITVEREYNVFALKAIGVDYTIPVRVHVAGLAHTFYRMGE